MAKVFISTPGILSTAEILNASDWLDEMAILSCKYKLRINPDGYVESLEDSDLPMGYAAHPDGKLKLLKLTSVPDLLFLNTKPMDQYLGLKEND